MGSGIEPPPADDPEPVLDDTRPVEVETLLADLSPPADVLSPADALPPDDALPEADMLPTAEPALTEEPQPAEETAAETPPPPLESAAIQREDRANLSVFEIFGLQKPSEARAQEGPPSEVIDEVQELMPKRESPLTPSQDIGLGEPAADPAPDSSARQPDERGVVSGISGWRRKARRRRRHLRTHS